MNRYKNTSGAVSVFLVIILVPCLLVTSIFADLGRVHLSKGMATSAADLALDALMTNFDADLNEWYGMVVSCQNIEEFYEASAQLYMRTLASTGLSEEEILSLVGKVDNLLGEPEIYDMLQVESLTAPSDMISEVPDANLTNPVYIKEEIVEFMKYRAPIELTLGIIDSLQKDKTYVEASKTEDTKPLVESKTAFYEAEGELLKAAFNSYVAIYDYFKIAVENGGLSNEKLSGYVDKLTEYKNVYSDIHLLMIKNLINTQGLAAYSRATASINMYSYSYTDKEIYSELEEKIIVVSNDDDEESEEDTSETESTEEESTEPETQIIKIYHLYGDKLQSLMDNLEKKITAFKAAKTNYENAVSGLMGNLPGTGDEQAYLIQWWVQMNAAVNTGSDNVTTALASAGREMINAYAKLDAIGGCQISRTENLEVGWETEVTRLKNEAKSLQGRYLVAGVSDDADPYLKAVKKLETVSANNINTISASHNKVTVDGETKSLDSAIAHIKSRLTAMKTELEGYVEYLDTAIDGNESDKSVPEGDRVVSLLKLTILAQNYDTSLGTWIDNVDTTLKNDSESSMAQNDKQEIGILTGEIKEGEDSKLQEISMAEFTNEITPTAVTELSTRLSNIRTQLKNVIGAIDSLIYGSEKLTGIGSYSTFKAKATAGTVKAADIKLTNAELKSYADTTFKTLFDPDTDPVYTLANLSDTSYNPVIDPKTGEVETPELFKYFHEKFRLASKNEVSTAEKEAADEEDIANDAEKNAKDKGRYHGGGSDITKDFSADGAFSFGMDSLTSIVNTIESIINLDFGTIRDDIYVTAYIMSMFSYATYQEEGLYSLVPDADKTKLMLTPASTAEKCGTHVPAEYDKYLGAADKAETWLSERYEDYYNKSLTNKLINKVNNLAYGAEIEYILYGGTNAENVKKVYSEIYAIRYALNLVSAFKNFWNNPTVKLIADTIQYSTAGIIPAPLTKVILLPILTIFETCKDMDRLEAGFPVELFKTNEDNWWIKVPGLKNIAGFATEVANNGLNGPNTGEGLFYSDYLTLFVYIGITGANKDAMYQRLAEVIQGNIRHISGDDSYSMKNARLYFRFEAQCRVSPLIISLPHFAEYDNNMDTETDWCTYNISLIRGY